MQATFDFLVQHGYLVLFLWVLAAQAGIPVPAIPLLIAAGALAGTGRLDVIAITGLSVVACLLSDSLWFAIGKRRGTKVLRFLCRVSLEPESCVRRTENTFARRGAITVVLAKFVPGLSTAAPPLAGMFGMRLPRFLWWDGIGALLWTLAAVAPGYIFSDQIERVAEHVAITGAWLLGMFIAGVALYVLVKLIRRQVFLQRLRIARISPDDLRLLLEGEQPPFVVDLRHPVDFDANPFVIPGTLHVTAEELEQRHHEIPRDRDIVLYCT